MPLLATKINIPPLREKRVHRSRLLARLTAGLSHKLTLISSPAGFGKTTLLSEFAAVSELPVAWFSIDQDDNDSVRFLTYLIGALGKIKPGFGGSIFSLLQTPKPESVETLLTILINEIIEELPPFVLVLDDYHLIVDQEINQSLAFLLEHQPEEMHLIIATRADPDLPLSRLRARNQLTEIREVDLRFTDQEAAEFLSGVMGLELDEEQLSSLEERTEGWAAGLQLAALSLQEQEDQEAFLRTFAGSNRYILDYLGQEVLDSQTQEVRDFLLKTSILERLNTPLSESLTGLKNSQQILEYLEANHLFTLPLDQERTWYRYHRLFQEYLRKSLADSKPDVVPHLDSKASIWFEQQGYFDEAIDHALRAGDHQRAVELIEAIAQSRLMRSEVSSLMRWIEALPEDLILNRPALCLTKAWALMVRGGSMEQVEGCLQEIEKAGVADQLLGSLYVLRSFQATMKGDALSGLEQSQRGLQLLSEDDIFLHSMVSDNLGMVYLMLGDFDTSIEHFKQAAEISRQAGNTMIEVGALCNIAGIWMLQGQLNKAWSTNQQALELATVTRGRRLPVAGKALLGLGEIAREWNELKTATDYLNEGLELFELYGELGSVISYLTLARIKEVGGDLDGAQAIVDHASQLAVEVEASKMDDLIVEAYQAQLWILQGRYDLAFRWIQENDLEQQIKKHKDQPRFDPIWEIQSQTLARFYISQGEYDLALQAIEPTLAVAEKNNRLRSKIKIHAMQAAICQSKGDSEGALGILERVLILGEPEGFVRTILDEGEPIVKLLYQAVSKGIHPDYAKKLLAAAMQIKPSELSIKNDPGKQAQLVEALSEREIDVLQLIADGLSNQEIANRLHISLSTVKGHTSNIFGKLGVHKRTQAVSRAIDLGILSSK
jgi:LuxR family maltose regulon positive regulatory protein